MDQNVVAKSKPRYDHEEVWLLLHEALETESKLIDTWADALE